MMMAERNPTARRLATVMVYVLCALVPVLAGGLGWALLVNYQQAQQIQAQREDSIRDSCVGQNARHDATIRALDRLLAQATSHASAERVRRIEESRASTVRLIEALAPARDCAAVVDRALGKR